MNERTNTHDSKTERKEGKEVGVTRNDLDWLTMRWLSVVYVYLSWDFIPLVLQEQYSQTFLRKYSKIFLTFMLFLSNKVF